MADHGRYDDDQTRDRERSRYGRDFGLSYDDERDRGRRSSMFGGGSQNADWHREQGRDQGWGGGERSRERYEGRFEDDGSTRSYDPAHHPDRGSSQDRSRGGRRFGSDDDHQGLPTDETSRLIASNKVEGTAVYGRDGHRLGSIYNFMVDKRSGRVEYAVMSYGGFLGMGTRYYPMPWDILGYDTAWAATVSRCWNATSNARRASTGRASRNSIRAMAIAYAIGTACAPDRTSSPHRREDSREAASEGPCASAGLHAMEAA